MNSKPRTRTRADLANALHREIGLSKPESRRLVDSILEMIVAALDSGAEVKVSNFGSFLLYSAGERMGRNPRTGEDAVITARQIVKFKPSKFLYADLNNVETDTQDQENEEIPRRLSDD